MLPGLRPSSSEYLIGHWLDKWFGTGYPHDGLPLILGIVGGSVQLIRELTRNKDS